MDERIATSKRRLQRLLRVAGGVAVVAGAHDVARGVGGVRGHRSGRPDPSVDSELRFFAAWYAAAGALMVRAADAPERDAATVRVISAAWAAGAAGRALSLRAAGRPHGLYLGLLGAEVVIATLLGRWTRELDGDFFSIRHG